MAGERSHAAAARRQEVAARVEELQDLLARIGVGSSLGPGDVALARQRLAVAMARAQEADKRVAEAHLRAAQAHRNAATVAERAGHADAARRHRDAAVLETLEADVVHDPGGAVG
jgi:hypothetical protein